ncbi:MAG: T9SS type A sorting domain-containing protein [Lewinellaceae bacterium]|nr:T9SS type A sorting domain-containing protein [Saprospiraceae bacterium]MCB9343512.1 T9SS type A sorting domain-containing protein [Lewinellaceae bacterium]
MKKILISIFLTLLLVKGFSQNQCNPDIEAPIPLCRTGLNVSIPPGETVTVWATDINTQSFDNCTNVNDLQFFLELAPASATPPSTQSFDFTEAYSGPNEVIMWVVDEAGNADYCQSVVYIQDCQSNPTLACNDMVYVSLDINGEADITPDMLLEGLYCPNNNPVIQIDQTGPQLPVYTLTFDDLGSHLYSVENSFNNTCWGTLIVTPGLYLDQTCPLLYVDLACNRIRPCFSSYYTVYYSNISVFPAEDAFVNVTLDPYLHFTSSTLPENDLGNNSYQFQVGDLAPGQDGTFKIYFTTDCDAPVGLTHCSEAHIYPDTICGAAGPWNGAEVEVNGHCQNDTIYLSIKNTGSAANSQVLDYIVVEDVLMFSSGTFNLNPGAELNLTPIAGTGATYRLEAQQEPNYPYNGLPSVTIEGCGGLNPGMVTLFPNSTSNPFESVFCRESTNSYDPNDKQALPKGYGDEHFITNDIPLSYMVRFQNTGTDTAYKVVIIDTLDNALSTFSIRMGASSHDYTFDLNQNILEITFDDIFLPHKAVDEPGSQGFVQFTINQQPNNPDGTVIENSAAIYFDFNPPVITNRTVHTIGSHFIAVVKTNEAPDNLPQLLVYPNPSTDVLNFDTRVLWDQPAVFTLTDLLGRQVLNQQVQSFPLTISATKLQSGTYFYQFASTNGQPLWSGKIIVK